MTMTNKDAVYKGKALHVAEFLSTFQGFFRINDAERKGPVSVELIERALSYRQRLLEHYDLENELVMFRKDGILSEDEIKDREKKIAESKASIESSPAPDKAVHELLRRFEVWSTQALANQVLTHCVKGSPGNNKDKLSICCSPVLNLPGAAHFLSFLPQQVTNGANGEKDHTCALGVPTNAWTWQEYLRMCSMASLLQDPQESMKSTLTAASPALIGQRKEELKMSEKDELTPADLVALWTRAQRNTSALLHLLHLFKITEAPEEPREEHYIIKASAQCRGKMLFIQDEESDSDEEAEPRYIAEYLGNHKKTRNYVLKRSGHLDKLVEWAVTNQALFTYRYIRESIPERLGQKKSPKKRSLPEEDTTEVTAPKRRKTICCEDETKLLEACQCYVLRWFARRNRKVVSILFSSKLKPLPLFPYERLVDKLTEHNVPMKVKKDLKERSLSKNTNRTLSRVDRRVRCDNFADESEPTKTFRGAVVLLLESLANVTPDTVLSKVEVLAACEDFKKLDAMFLSGKTATEAAEILLDPEADFDENPADLLLAFNEPYFDRCFICNEALDDDDADVIQCDNCSKLFHNSCEGSACDVHPISELMEAYPPLARVNAAVPDEIKPVYDEIWRCSACQVAAKARSSENRIFTEARWCKALIRDVGMESFSLPFHDESIHQDSESSQSCDQEGRKVDKDWRHVSLRRLDAMMDYISLKHDPSVSESSRQKQLNSIGNPFLSPMTTPLPRKPSQPLEWVTEEMMQNPMQLLCKGIERMILSSKGASSDDTTAFLSRFTRIFSAWFLSTCKESLPLQPSGALSHTLVARVPWPQPSCVVCRARPADATASESPVCDNTCCQQLHSSGKLNRCQAEDNGSSLEGMSGFDTPVRKYDELSSLVGSPIIVLPGDPMLQFVSRELNLSIDHMDRPVLFFVASYLPRLFATSESQSSQIDDEGVFHILPVLSDHQLKFLLEKLVMRRPPESHIDGDSWTQLGVLNLKGVLRMSSAELKAKLKETAAIREAVDSALKAIVRSRSIGATDCQDKESCDCVSTEQRTCNRSAAVCGNTADLLSTYSALIDCLLRSQNPLVRSMIGMLRPATGDADDSTEIESVSCDSQASVEEAVDQQVDDSELYGSIDPQSSNTREEHFESTKAALSETFAGFKAAPEVPPAASFSTRNQTTGRIPLGAPPQQPEALSNNTQAAQPPPPHGNPQIASWPPPTPIAPRAPPPPGNPQIAPRPPPQLGNRQMIHPPTQPTYRVGPNDQRVLGAVPNRASMAGDQPPGENFISKEDLHQPGLGILTRIETAIYLEANSRSLFQLALRLLCPRYNVDRLRRQVVPEIMRGDNSQIPRVQPALWKYVVHLDFTRAMRETGEKVLVDITSEDTYRYCIPVMPLPLDRITEAWLARQLYLSSGQASCIDLSGNAAANHDHHTQGNQDSEPPVDRLRGGGPSDEGLFEIQHDPDEEDAQIRHGDANEGLAVIQANANAGAVDMQPEIVNEPTALVDIPRNTWPGTLVYIRIITTVFGEGREEAVTLGIVQEMGQHDEDEVPVALFYFSNTGYINDPALHAFPATQLLVVQEESHEANIAERWEGRGRFSLPRRVSEDQMDGVSSSQNNEVVAESEMQHDAVVDETTTLPESPVPPSQSNEIDDVAETQQDQINEPSISAGDSSDSQQNITHNEEDESGEAIRHVQGSKATGLAEPPTPSQNDEKEGREEAQEGTVYEMNALADTPKDSWENTFVFSNVIIEGNEAKVIGFVQPISDTNEQDDKTEGDEVTIALFHLSNMGYLPEASGYKLPTDSVYVVQEGSDEARIAEQWGGLEQVTGSTPRIAPPARTGDGDESTRKATNAVARSAAPRDNEREGPAENTSHETLSMEDVGKTFTRELCQRQQGPAPIGHLPDGRAVLWVQSDPRALYVRMRESHVCEFSTADDSELESRPSCPWRCCDARDIAPLCFETQMALQEHLRVRHDFGQLPDNVVDVEGVGRLFRITEGQVVMSLSAQLTSAICALSPELSGLSDHSSSETGTFRLEEILELTSGGRGSAQKNILDALQSKPKALSLLLLWSRVARLFAVESTGLFRAETEDCETVFYFEGQEEPLRAFDIGQSGVLSAEDNGCLNQEKNAAAFNESSNCSLCGSRWDPRMKFSSVSPNDNAGEGGATPDIVGCDLLCLSCRASYLIPESIPELDSCGPAGVARSMLIRVAASVPTQLRRRANGNDGTAASSAAKEAFMWEEGNYQNWRFLVERSYSVRSLLQALVVLLHSLHTSKLPRWWTGAREGWTSTFATMASAPHGYSALFLRLWALDAAISEYMVPVGAVPEDLAPLVLRGISTTEERMETVQEWANALSYARYDGEHNGECTFCKDGGDLLCCEYCRSTQHAACCFPQIADASALNIWICPMCTADLAVAVGADDGER